MKTLGLWLGVIAVTGSVACSSDDKASGSPDGGVATGGVFGSGGAGAGGASSGGASSGGASSGGTSSGGTSSGGTSSGGQTASSGGAGGAAGSTGGAASGGSPADGGGGTQAGTPFLPSSLQVEYVGTGSSGGLEIVALTLVQDGELGAPTVYVAVKKTGPNPVCIVDVPMDFFDSSNTKLAHSMGAGSLRAPMYDSFGSPTECLGDGDIGMGTITLGISSLDVSKVAKIEHGFSGNIDPAATKLTGVTATTQVEATFGTSVDVTGTVTNGGSTSIKNPEIHVFPVDSAGRPYGDLTQLDLITVPAGGTWPYTTTSFKGAIKDKVVYVSYQ